MESCRTRIAKGGIDAILLDEESVQEAREELHAIRKDILLIAFTSADADVSDLDGHIHRPVVQAQAAAVLVEATWQVEAQHEGADQVEIRELWEISKALGSGQDTTTLLEKIVSSALRVTGADTGSIMLLDDEEPETLYVAAATGSRAELRRGKKLRFDQSVAGWVMRTGEPLLLQGGLDQDERFRHLPTRLQIHSSLCVPIKSLPGDLMGVLSLNREVTPGYFGMRDLRVMTIYASEAAAIIANVKAFAALQEAYAKLKRTSDRLKSIQAQLVHSSKMAAVGLLASGIAHEFNNILTGILGMSQLAQHTGKDRHVQKALKVAEENSNKAKEIVKNLLSFSGRYKKVREKCEISPMVEDVLSLMKREMEREGIAIRRDLKEVCVARVNRSEIQQVLLNLLINAKQAIDGPGWIEIRVSDEGADVHVVFSDSGCGIAPENIPRIFDPFFSTKSLLFGGDNQGAGLGLSVSYGIVRGHGGEILVTSEVGAGTTFTVVLPKKPARRKSYTDSYPCVVDRGPREELSLPPPGQRRIVVVDDEEWIRSFLRETLTEMGFEIFCASDGEKGLALVREKKPFLILLDLALPGIRGEEVGREILKRFPDTAVIYMTGTFQSLETIEKTIEKGIYAYLSKPFDVQDVRNLLNLDQPQA